VGSVGPAQNSRSAKDMLVKSRFKLGSMGSPGAAAVGGDITDDDGETGELAATNGVGG